MIVDARQKIEQYLAQYNSGDMEAAISHFADDCIYEDVLLGLAIRGKDKLEPFLKKTNTFYPDINFVIDHFFQSGDNVAFEWTMTGTSPKTGEKHTIRGVNISVLKEGKFYRHSAYSVVSPEIMKEIAEEFHKYSKT